MENGRMVINGFGFGVLVLALSINLSANNIVCVNGKCRASYQRNLIMTKTTQIIITM